jgi:glycosyltransferase involved in cell wall biosynthesis
VGRCGLSRDGACASADSAGQQVSCIVPVFNAEHYIGDAIESILRQTCPPGEVLVVDDGSTDGTATVVESFGASVILLRRPHRGGAAAKNAALEIVRGPYIAFLDADDVWVRDKLARQLARCCAQPSIDLSFTAYDNFWIPELAEEAGQYRERKLSLPSTGWSLSTLLTRISSFDRFGRFAESEAENYYNLLWALGAASQGAVVDVLPEVLMHRRLHHSNVSRSWSIDEKFVDLVKTWRDYRKSAPREHGGESSRGGDTHPSSG